MFQILQNLFHQILSKSLPTLVQLRLNFPIRVVSAHCGLFWGICGRCGGPDVSAIVINCELLTHMTFVVGGCSHISQSHRENTQTTIAAIRLLLGDGCDDSIHKLASSKKLLRVTEQQLQPFLLRQL